MNVSDGVAPPVPPLRSGEPPLAILVDYDGHPTRALLIHGRTGNKEDFADLGPFPFARGYRVVTFDQEARRRGR